MNYPPGLLAVALLFWTALSRTEVAAASLLGLLLLSKLSSWRWQLDAKQFFRLGDLTSVLVVLALAYVYATQDVDRPIYLILKWLPALFAPLLFAQLFGSTQRLPLGALFYSRRRRTPQPSIDFRVPYAGVCVLAAGAANVQTPAYFIGSALLFSWMLFYARPRRRELPLWLLLVMLALGGAYYGQQGLRQLQLWIEGRAEQWLSNWTPDPYQNRTSIGDVGALKLSGKIELRVAAAHPQLLHQATYDRYAGQSWYASQRKFSNTALNSDSATSSSQQQMTFFSNFERQAILALPQGVEKIAGIEGALLSTTTFGVIKAEDLPSFAQYRVYYSGVQTSQLGKYDLELPERHRDWAQQLAAQLGLGSETPTAAAAHLRHFFKTQYRYSLYLGGEHDADRALRDFVLTRKAGHCEYFAAATVLVLRAAGIPARLATGYSLQEYAHDQQLYIVRRRHAHAWALAFIDGRWQEVDTTPAQWAELEAEQSDNVWQSIEDFFSRIAFEFKRWRSSGNSHRQQVGLSIVALLSLFLAWRLYRNRAQWQRSASNQSDGTTAENYPGRDSPWYRLEQALQGTELARRSDESVQQWSERLQQPVLLEIARLHYRYRFDPAGLSADELARLQTAVDDWLAT